MPRRGQLRDHVVGGRNERSPSFADRTMRSFARRLIDAAGDGHRVATVVLDGEPRRDRRAAPSAGLDEHHAERESGDDPIPAREELRPSLGLGRLFAENGAAARDAFQKSLDIAQKLASAEPDRADYQRDLSVSFNKMGDL
jgi:hypothetical protein